MKLVYVVYLVTYFLSNRRQRLTPAAFPADDVLTVRQAEPRPQLERLLDFLDLTVPAERLACLEDSTPPAAPTRGQQALRDPAVRRTIAEHVRQVGELLRRRGHSLNLEQYMADL